MSNNEIEKTQVLKLPYGNVRWYEKFFDVIRSKAFSNFDKSIIELNIVKGSNAGILFNGLKSLGLVNDDGTVTEKFDSLRKIGDEFKENLKLVINEAYSDLFSKVVVSQATPENLYNYMSEYCGYGEAASILASKIFVYLCKEAEIELSQELEEGQYKTSRKKGKTTKGRKEKKKQKQRSEKVSSNMHESVWGNDIVINLRKADRKTREKIARTAKKLIDMYVEEAEEERTSSSS